MRMHPEESIAHFIRLIRGAAPSMMRHIFTEGGCYRFYLILKGRYPKAVAYHTRDYHVITKIAGRYWDITGPLPDDSEYKIMTEKDHDIMQSCQFDELSFMCRLAQLKVSQWENGI